MTILSLLKGKSIFFIGLGIIVLTYMYFTLELTKNKLEVKEKEYKSLEDSALIAIDELNKSLLLQMEVSIEENINKNLKIELIKQNEKVKQESIKRGEIEQDENSDFIVVNF
ncbi:hypothetical protein AAX29_00551 [Aliarcobacter thereius]|uniref:Uncharacterized protein n=1 Tax=Aliarcobacter thereius TaxID=544718 RepID=A0A1C0B7E3_9BACT|nr:hypothetical protein [Aliarcobacter thereius]OCL99510.1 hypothetical protein AAX29_00551 [Aliarcobacter thereius]